MKKWHTSTHKHTLTRTHTHSLIHTNYSVSLCVCVCVCEHTRAHHGLNMLIMMMPRWCVHTFVHRCICALCGLCVSCVRVRKSAWCVSLYNLAGDYPQSYWINVKTRRIDWSSLGSMCTHLRREEKREREDDREGKRKREVRGKRRVMEGMRAWRDVCGKTGRQP